MERNSIDLTVIDNKITNINEIISILNSNYPDKMGQINYFKTLKNRITSSDFDNKEEVIEILNSKIIESTLALQDHISNKEVLSILKDISTNFTKLGFVSTSANDNDSNQYIDYITYINDYGEIEMIPCVSEYVVYNFIKEMANTLVNMNAKEFFDYFTKYISKSLNFQSPEDLKKDLETRKQACVFDAEIEKLELEEVESYKRTYGITSEINVTIDEAGERIYRIKDGIIKFKTVGTNREMQVLKPPTLKVEDEYASLLSELDDDPLEVEHPETVSVATYKDSFDSLETITYDTFNNTRLKEIIAKRDVYDIELTYEEQHELNVYIKYLLTHMQDTITSLKEVDEQIHLFRDVMEAKRGTKASYVDTFEAIKSGLAKENELDDLEKTFTEKYLKCKEKMQELKIGNNLEKKLELKDNSGLATIIVLMELITLAMFIMMFLRLDI